MKKRYTALFAAVFAVSMITGCGTSNSAIIAIQSVRIKTNPLNVLLLLLCRPQWGQFPFPERVPTELPLHHRAHSASCRT